jgi:hypothetical protein
MVPCHGSYAWQFHVAVVLPESTSRFGGDRMVSSFCIKFSCILSLKEEFSAEQGNTSTNMLTAASIEWKETRFCKALGCMASVDTKAHGVWPKLMGLKHKVRLLPGTRKWPGSFNQYLCFGSGGVSEIKYSNRRASIIRSYRAGRCMLTKWSQSLRKNPRGRYSAKYNGKILMWYGIVF